MRSRRPVSLLLPALTLAAPLAAQRPSPDDYLAYLPPTPRIVARSIATSRLRLYGDPARDDSSSSRGTDRRTRNEPTSDEMAAR